MSVSGVNPYSQYSTQTSSLANTSGAASNARALDGDYKAPGHNTAKVKDADGDYKVLKSSAVATSSSTVQQALTILQAGG